MRQNLKIKTDFQHVFMLNVYEASASHVLMTNHKVIYIAKAHDGLGHYTKSDENLIFLPAKPHLRPDVADSLVVRILILYKMQKSVFILGQKMIYNYFLTPKFIKTFINLNGGTPPFLQLYLHTTKEEQVKQHPA